MPTKSRTAWRILILLLAIATWLGCFTVLVRWGTWTVFAVAGGALAAFAYRIDPAVSGLLRPSLAKLGVGLMMGVVMLALTHVGFALSMAFRPGLRAATLELYHLLNGVGLSPLARATLVVLIAASEEVLFRGGLADSEVRGLEGTRPVAIGRRSSRVVVLAIVYAAATLPLGSPLLSACAFFCGVAWGGLRVATRSLVPPIVAHIAWDLGVLLVWPLVRG